jgi:hypothetical protein
MPANLKVMIVLEGQRPRQGALLFPGEGVLQIVAATACFRNRQRALSLGGGNASSCPEGDLCPRPEYLSE